MDFGFLACRAVKMNEVYFQIAVLLNTSLAFDVAVLNTIFYYFFIGRVNQLL